MKLFRIALKKDEEYFVGNKLCRLEKVTEKGYNFIVIETGKPLLKRLIYPAGQTMLFTFGSDMYIRANEKNIKPDTIDLSKYAGTYTLDQAKHMVELMKEDIENFKTEI